MFGLNSISLTNVGVYEGVTIDALSDQGFVVIHGKNNDAATDISNGCGKSMLFNSLPCVLFEAPPMALAKRAKGEYLGKKGAVEISWTAPNGKEYVVQQKASKYVMTEDGENLKVDRQDVARQLIQEHFPISRQEFYTYAYLNAAIPHPFQRATPAARMQYITELFRLDMYDKLRAVFLKRLDECKNAEKDIAVKAQLLTDLETKRSAIRLPKKAAKQLARMKAALDDLRSDEAKLNKSARKLAVLVSNAKAAYSAQAKLLALPKFVRKINSPSEAKAEMAKLRKQIDMAEDYAKYKKQLKKYEAKSTELTARKDELSAALSGSESVKDIEKKHRALAKESENLTSEYEANLELYREYEDALSGLALAKKAFAKLSKPEIQEKRVSDVKAYAKAFLRMAEELHDHKGSTCPTCMSKLDRKEINKQAKKAKRDLEDAEAAEEYYQLNDEIAGLKASVLTYEKNGCADLHKKQKKIKSRIRELDSEMDALESLYEVVTEFIEVKAELKGLSKPDKVEAVEIDVDKAADKIECLAELRSLLTTLKAIEVPDVPLSALKDEEKELDKKMAKVRKESDALSSDYLELKSKVVEFDLLTKQIEELQEAISGASEILSQKKVAECLYNAYGSKHLKQNAVNRVLRQLQQQMNEFSHLVFPEPMRFELKAEGQGVSAYVTHVARNETVEIASTLSGAESNCFRLLFALSVLPFIPDARRPNFIVLDEPENGCSPALREHLIREFLPIIRDVVPNVFWITPLDIEVFGDVPVWTAVKTNGVTTLEKN